VSDDGAQGTGPKRATSHRTVSQAVSDVSVDPRNAVETITPVLPDCANLPTLLSLLIAAVEGPNDDRSLVCARRMSFNVAKYPDLLTFMIW